MEEKLKKYRTVRRRKELIENTKNKIEKTKDKLVELLIPKIIRDMGKINEEVILIENDQPPEQPIDEMNEFMSELSDEDPFDEDPDSSWKYCFIKWFVYSIIWFGLFICFVKMQFGAVFFVVSVLIGIYCNTRTRPRKKGEVSAYSVFNKNCASIDGTLKPEQFEREIRYGVGTVRSF